MTQSETGSGTGGELGALAHALAAHARRRGALGLRAVPLLPPAAPPPVRTSDAAQARPGPGRAQAAAPAYTPPAPASTDGRAEAPAGAKPAIRPSPAAARPPVRPPGPGPAARGAASSPASPPAARTDGAPVAAGPAPADVAPGCATLEALRAGVAACTACPLARTRQNTVFADGTGSSGVLFVGEGPGAEEDRAGVPFVGRAGKLLTDIVTKGMGLAREDVAIVNVVKCRPPENRDPTPEEKAACAPWLDRQLELFDPKVIVPLGRHAATTILGVDAPLGRLRARVHDARGRKVVPTYHPAYLLRAPQEKKKTWEDIQLAMREAGISVPGER